MLAGTWDVEVYQGLPLPEWLQPYWSDACNRDAIRRDRITEPLVAPNNKEERA